MIVRLTTSLLWNGRLYSHGDEVDLPDNIAGRYISTNQAEPVNPTQPDIETAALRTQPARGRKDVRTTATRSRA